MTAEEKYRLALDRLRAWLATGGTEAEFDEVYPVAAAAESVALCTHRCLKPENHDGPHFYGYNLPSDADEIERLTLLLGARNTEIELEWIEQNQRLRRAFDAAVAYIHGGQDRGAESQVRYTAWLNARNEVTD